LVGLHFLVTPERGIETDRIKRERNSERMFFFADFAKTRILQNIVRVQTLISL